jgi:hypothetical protein
MDHNWLIKTVNQHSTYIYIYIPIKKLQVYIYINICHNFIEKITYLFSPAIKIDNPEKLATLRTHRTQYSTTIRKQTQIT